MPKYLFTNDLRISELPSAISTAVKSIHDPLLWNNKSSGNNASTLQFYFNLFPNTDIVKKTESDPFYAIRNFVKKFQFPNTRTKESFDDSIEERTLLAPYRVIVTLLLLMDKEHPNEISKLSLWEIMWFVFCTSISKNPQIDYELLSNQILQSRRDNLDLEKMSESVIQWKQHERQLREMLIILCYASNCFSYKNKELLFVKNEAFIKDEEYILSIINFDKIWYPSDKYNFELSQKEYIEYMDTKDSAYSVIDINSFSKKEEPIQHIEYSDYSQYITAIKTKPFILLAGISGTGKSRIVREFAFKSCPKYLQDKAGTTPGNYCMIEVKPNWHDSTELLGYYSRLGQAGYQFKKFVKFLVKAKMFPKVPFFICLDEMNLAPVEQYFAEILSILETRKHPKKEGTNEIDMSVIKTGVIIDAGYFREFCKMKTATNIHTGDSFYLNLTDRDVYLKLFDIDTEDDIDEEVGNRYDLLTEGLTLPDNVVIIGTVNMDDTTHQFSRKVIDRAMTIEMNGGRLANMFGGSKNLEYSDTVEEQQKWQHSFSQRYVTADEVLEAHPKVAERIKEQLPDRLEKINEALNGTPFEVSYRVLNELTIMVGVMLDNKSEKDTIDDIINQAINNILLMKILPRIEGDAEMFALSRAYKERMGVAYNDRLEWLKALAPDIQNDSVESTDEDEESEESPIVVKKEHLLTAKEKIQEMIDRLNNQEFTRFWP